MDGFLNDDGNANAWVEEAPPAPEEEELHAISQEHAAHAPSSGLRYQQQPEQQRQPEQRQQPLHRQPALQQQPPEEPAEEAATLPPPAKRPRLEAAENLLGAPAASCVIIPAPIALHLRLLWPGHAHMHACMRHNRMACAAALLVHVCRGFKYLHLFCMRSL